MILKKKTIYSLLLSMCILTAVSEQEDAFAVTSYLPSETEVLRLEDVVTKPAVSIINQLPFNLLEGLINYIGNQATQENRALQTVESAFSKHIPFFYNFDRPSSMLYSLFVSYNDVQDKSKSLDSHKEYLTIVLQKFDDYLNKAKTFFTEDEFALWARYSIAEFLLASVGYAKIAVGLSEEHTYTAEQIVKDFDSRNVDDSWLKQFLNAADMKYQFLDRAFMKTSYIDYQPESYYTYRVLQGRYFNLTSAMYNSGLNADALYAQYKQFLDSVESRMYAIMSNSKYTQKDYISAEELQAQMEQEKAIRYIRPNINLISKRAMSFDEYLKYYKIVSDPKKIATDYNNILMMNLEPQQETTEEVTSTGTKIITTTYTYPNGNRRVVKTAISKNDDINGTTIESYEEIIGSGKVITTYTTYANGKTKVTII